MRWRWTDALGLTLGAIGVIFSVIGFATTGYLRLGVLLAFLAAFVSLWILVRVRTVSTIRRQAVAGVIRQHLKARETFLRGNVDAAIQLCTELRAGHEDVAEFRQWAVTLDDAARHQLMKEN